MTSISIAALLVAVAAAVRSTWSPCGVSMLSTITPLAERSRGRRYGVTATWFVAGAVGGGLALGALAALGALLVSAVSPSHAVVVGLAVACSLICAAADGRLVRVNLPHHRRQVNEMWLDRYRGWVYGVGFGGQIGFGLATFIMTTAVYLTIAFGALTARPLVALAIGAAFGLVRGLAVLAGSTLTTPDRLRRFHQRFEAWRSPVARWVVVIECAVAVVLAGSVNPFAGAVVAVVVAGVVLGRVRHPGAGTAAPTDPSSVPAAPEWTAAGR